MHLFFFRYHKLFIFPLILPLNRIRVENGLVMFEIANKKYEFPLIITLLKVMISSQSDQYEYDIILNHFFKPSRIPYELQLQNEV